MKTWKQYFAQAGGISLLKRYLNNRTLAVAALQFITLGREKKSLEILRLSVNNKLYKRICHLYMNKAKTIAKTYQHDNNQNPLDSIKKIWICWWQGMQNSPELVRVCYDSVKRHFSDWQINVITNDNYTQFVQFPQHIIEKWNKGIISNTHMSDILRVELLNRYGGLWLDATVYCSSSNIPQSILNSNLFMFQCLKPGSDGHTVPFSSWLIYSKPNQPILRLTRDLLFRYWEKNDELMDYFLLHYFLTLSSEIFPDDRNDIPEFCNSIPHILLLNLFNKFNELYWKDLCNLTCFHKLSYKFDKELKDNLQNTYYYNIITSNNEISQ